MKKLTLLFLGTVTVFLVRGQAQNLSLEQCYTLAIRNHPLSGQNALYDQYNAIQQKILENTNLPQLNLNGQATYQSAVTELPIQLPGFSAPAIPRDQFKVTADATQIIYGGGVNQKQKLLEQDNLLINKLGNDSELYRVKEKINQLYFNILLNNSSREILMVNREDLETRLKKIESGVMNGAVLPVNLSVLEAELIKVDQRIIEVKAQKKTFLSMLSILIGTEIDSSAQFSTPVVGSPTLAYANYRPEYQLFDLQSNRFGSLKSLTMAKRNPRAIAFGNLGYGRPGLNMFKEEAELFYVVGAKLSWNMWNWHQTRQELQMIDISRDLLENQKKSYDLSIRSAVQQFTNDMEKTRELLVTDHALIDLRKEITRATASQLENGLITASEYLTEYNAEIQARLSLALHEVQLIQAWYAYQAMTGNLK